MASITSLTSLTTLTSLTALTSFTSVTSKTPIFPLRPERPWLLKTRDPRSADAVIPATFAAPAKAGHHAMFLDTIEKKQLTFDRKKLTDAELLDIYERLLRPRLIEEKMLSMLRQGRISKWFSGIGQEAVAVGAALAMEPDEYILPMHRNLGTFTTRGVPMARLFSQFQGYANGFTK